jgi:hypothetical protein
MGNLARSPHKRASAHNLCTGMVLRTQIFSTHDQAVAAAIPPAHDGGRKFSGAGLQPLQGDGVSC